MTQIIDFTKTEPYKQLMGEAIEAHRASLLEMGYDPDTEDFDTLDFVLWHTMDDNDHWKQKILQKARLLLLETVRKQTT